MIITTVSFDNSKSLELLRKMGVEKEEVVSEEDGYKHLKVTLK